MSSSSWVPEKRIGGPNQRWYLTGSGSGIPVRVIGSEGKPISFAAALKSKNAGACSSAPTTATGSTGVCVSSAKRMKPLPNSCSW